MICILLIAFLIGLTVLHKLYKIVRQKDVRGQIVLITGGASGIGRQVCEFWLYFMSKFVF
jgi:NADPH:quinone reductase-like Zn-dependent oxidoreductase